MSYHDPYVPALELRGRRLLSAPLSAAALKGADCVVILTAHKEVDYARILRMARRVFDARNATRGLRAESLSRL